MSVDVRLIIVEFDYGYAFSNRIDQICVHIKVASIAQMIKRFLRMKGIDDQIFCSRKSDWLTTELVFSNSRIINLLLYTRTLIGTNNTMKSIHCPLFHQGRLSTHLVTFSAYNIPPIARSPSFQNPPRSTNP